MNKNYPSDIFTNCFQLGIPLGKGSCGSVYEATLTKPLLKYPGGHKVAVKIIHPEHFESKIIMARLRREIEIGVRVRSRNVVSIFSIEKCKQYGQTTLAIIMELIDGVTLKQIIMKNNQPTESSVIAIARQIANGLKDIHEINIVHRDVKPANLMITATHRVVLTDLGIARLPDISAQVTATGTFIGTCAYASPEQFANIDLLDPRSDLYSMGVVLYETATGINPFLRENLMASIQTHLHGIIDPPSTLNPNLSPVCDELIMNLLEKDRKNRPASAGKVLDFLSSFRNPDAETQSLPIIN